MSTLLAITPNISLLKIYRKAVSKQNRFFLYTCVLLFLKALLFIAAYKEGSEGKYIVNGCKANSNQLDHGEHSTIIDIKSIPQQINVPGQLLKTQKVNFHTSPYTSFPQRVFMIV